MDLEKFEKLIGIKFNDQALLRRAFTHRSYINENKSAGLENNERLEFLGDAVLELVITDYLFNHFKEMNEGELTSLRSALVNADTCSQVASSINVNDFLLLSKGESKDVGRARQYILADTLEAIIGAIYIDQGYDSAKNFINKYIVPLTDSIVAQEKWIDSKSLFQEKAQEFKGLTPVYKTIKETGPDHDKHFTVGVYVGKELMGKGEGKSKQDAEQEAAKMALDSQGWS